MKHEAVAASSLLMKEPCAKVARQPWRIHSRWLIATFISILLVATLFWCLGTTFFGSQPTITEPHQVAVLITSVTVGGYQLYFWVEHNNLHVPVREIS